MTRETGISSRQPGQRFSRVVRLRIAVQKDRALLFSLALAVGVGLKMFALLDVSYSAIALLFALSNSSALLLAILYKRRIPLWILDMAWIGVDVFFVSSAIFVTGGAQSPWFPWYLPVISGVAFVIGLWAAFFSFLACLGSYVLTLILHGDIDGWGPQLFEAVSLMVCLYAASVFFLRGVKVLQQKRRVISDMEVEGRKKVLDLTRLTTELESKSEELKRANVQLRESDRLKSQFLANVSHELRTPLNSILGFSEILSSRLSDEEDERQTRYLGYIHESGRRLLSVIDDILDLSRMESGTMVLAPERMAVRSTVEGVCTLLTGPASRRAIQLETDIPECPLIEADPTRVKQVLYHLIDNAVKFSAEGSRVSVRARILSSENPFERDHVEFEVEDRGIGMAKNHKEMIFKPFTQIDGSIGREYEGAGLGLAIVDRAVALHQGTIEVESEPGEGSVFRVLLPLGLQAGSIPTDPRFSGEGEAYA